MQYLYFKSSGELWVISRRLDPALAQQYPNPIAVEDDFDVYVDTPEVAVEAGMPPARRTKIRTEVEASVSYSTRRKAEYPPIGDQLDALWRGGDAAAEMLATVQAVKAKYPKPIADAE